jgi:hypothetical protein
MKRRDFLATCATCLAGVGGLTLLNAGGILADKGPAKPRIRLVFTHIPPTDPTWPNIGYDYETRKKELTEILTKAVPDIEFVSATVQNGHQAERLLEAADPVDGYLVYMLGIWTGAPQVIGSSGKPTLFVDDLYGGSGEFLVAYSAALRAGQKVAGVSSSRMECVIDAVKCFEILKKPGATADDFLTAAKAAIKRNTAAPGDLTCTADPVESISADECMKKLRASKILVIGGGGGEEIEALYGTKVIRLRFSELDEAYLKADREEAAKWAKQWVAGAEKVIEPTAAEIENSGAMYLAELELLKCYDAQAITINCLGGFYGGRIKAYPCLGFCQLNNDGLVGACEADLRSTFTMLAVGCLTGRPGYISDPVIDTSKNRIIYTHCVAPTKVFGPKGPSNPYHIRDHSEDRKGAAMRSLMPLGHITTSLEIDPGRKQLLFHQGKTVENVDDDKACRTKLSAEVKGDVEKLMTYWDEWGWHRVTFYGDLKGPLAEFCKTAGLTMIEEA